MKYQRGATLMSMLFYSIVVIMIAVLIIKLTPPYIEHFSVKKVINAIGNEPDLSTMTPADIRRSFDRRASVDYITVLKGEDLDITKKDGQTVVSADYAVKVPLVGNITALLDFSASTSPSRTNAAISNAQ